MSFECDCCGKNSVDRPGKWCSECQEREYNEQMAWEAKWFSESRLCQQCSNSWGPDPSDLCDHYRMPLSMCKRKYKCKHFKEINYKMIDKWEVAEFYDDSY